MVETAAANTVLIVGGGIVGPVLALLLHQKGWKPIIVEKVRDLGESGLAIAIHPNGLKVLSKANVAQDLLRGTVPWLYWNEYTSSGSFLGGPGSELPASWEEKYGWPAVGLSRTRIQLCLREIAIARGIRYEQGWRLKDIRQAKDGVVAVAEDEREIEASFVLGCDGLKSATREVLLRQKGMEVRDPDFTGIGVIGGVAPTPAFQQEHQGVNNWYGGAVCMISHPIENGLSVWGMSYVPETGVAESWRTIPQKQLEKEVEELLIQFRDWPEPVKQLIAGSKKIQTIGLYDRKELDVENWFHDRIMLIGDAAHPTTPHIGQGANQGLEDAWALAQTIPDFDGKSPSTETLTRIFREVAQNRQPKTTQIVIAGRSAGEKRVIRGGESDVQARLERDDKVRKEWQDAGALTVLQDGLYKQPFEDLGGFRNIVKESTG